jgi:hypothetical protein
VLSYGHSDCPAISQAPLILPNSCSTNPMNTVYRLVPIHYLRFVLPTWNLVRHTKPIDSRHPAGGSAQ